MKDTKIELVDLMIKNAKIGMMVDLMYSALKANKLDVYDFLEKWLEDNGEIK